MNQPKHFIKLLHMSKITPFEEFWSMYPNTIGQSKKKTREKYNKVIKTKPHKEILQALKKQIDEYNLIQAKGDTWQPMWKHAATWINQECWDNEIVSAPKTKRPKSKIDSRGIMQLDTPR